MRTVLITALLATALPTAALAAPHATASRASGPLGGVGPLAAPATNGWWTAAGATWSEDFITEPDGTTLHADVLRPAGLPSSAKTPVILTIGPYYGHAGELGVEGAPAYYPLGAGQPGPQPDPRFQDFLTGAHVFDKGYTWVQVDLRGYGGSSGCYDLGGPGEQADVASAVTWAADQRWSTGRVGMYGKSYDGFTGVMGEAMQPRGLDAIVAMEPVYDLYDLDYANGVPAASRTDAETYAYNVEPAFTPGDDPRYALDQAELSGQCATTEAGARSPSRTSSFWKARDLISEAAGHTVPFFLTQGFLEDNTRPGGAWDFYNELKGPKHAWFTMSDHIRGNDVAEGDGKAPKPWFGAVMRFYDTYLKGVPGTASDPSVAVETSNGSWRAEQQWPPVDATAYRVPLTTGSYTDSGFTADGQDGGGDSSQPGVWTVSPPLANDAHYAGVASSALDVTSSLPNGTLSVNVYDVPRTGKATLLTRAGYLLQQGKQVVRPELYGNDWLVPAGHRIAVEVGPSDDGWWNGQHLRGTVTVNAGSSVTLPWLRYTRPVTLSRYKVPSRLRLWTGGAGRFTVLPATVSAATTRAFPRPEALQPAPAGFNHAAYGTGLPFVSHGHDASPGTKR